jgi:hypothetical protein
MLKEYELQNEFRGIDNLSAPKYWIFSAIINNINTYIYSIYIYVYNAVYVLSGVLVRVRQEFQ